MNALVTSRWGFGASIWLVRILALAILVSVALAYDHTASESHRNNVRQAWLAELDQQALKIKATILQNIQTVWGLAANVSLEPDIDQKRFDELAPVIFSLAPQLKNIGLAPDYVIRYIYPLAGNEKALGLDISRQSLSPADIRLLHERRNAVFTGPIPLIQGGTGLAGRIPIYTHDTKLFWGVVSVIVDLEKLYEDVGLNSLPADRRFAISSSADHSAAEAMFFYAGTPNFNDPISSTLSLQGINWTLFAEPVDGWPNHPESPWLVRTALIFTVVITAALVFWLTSLFEREQNMQRRLWGLFELAPVGIGLYDARSGRRLRGNPSHQACFGDAANELTFFDQNEFNDQPRQRALISELLAHDGRFSSIERQCLCADNSIRPILLFGLKLSSGKRDDVVWLISEDMTEMKKLGRMKSEFISIVSHELRTPLTSITGALGLLSNNAAGHLPDKAQNLTDIAYRNSRQLATLINDLLDIEKLIAGKMAFDFESWAVADLVKEAVEDIQTYAHERSVRTCLLQISKSHVWVDRNRFKQALNNLLSNAIKFSHERGTVEVFTRPNGAKIQICVRDYGEGVPPEFKDRIFEKFSQADSSDRRQKGGSGLGLAITRELIERMNGRVGFESTPGEGALFWLELPVYGQ